MAVLEKIRVKLGILITVLIAVALLAFIVDPTTLETTVRYFSSKYDVGKIDGNKVRYEDFQKELDHFQTIYTLSSGSQSVSEEAQIQINEMAWQNLIQEYYVIPRMKEAGLRVGDEEVIEMSQGKEISPILSQDPAFMDETGQFSRERLLDFIHAIPSDPSGNLEMYWSYIQEVMIYQQYLIKYASLLSKSNIVTPVALRREIEENNTSADVDFVLVPFGFEPDSTLTVTDSEVSAYYKKHLDSFKQLSSRDVEFVAYEVVPSDEDIAATEKQVNGLFEEFSTTENLKTFLARNSDTPLQNYYYKKGELESSFPEIDEFAFSGKSQVLPVFRKVNTFIAARIMDVKTMPDSVFVQHILLPFDAEQRADSLLNVLRNGGDFKALAERFSLDKNPNVAQPGDIGWMTQAYMIPGMEEVMTLPVGRYEKMKSDYGFHVVRVTDRTAPSKKVQIAVLSREAVASKETYQSFYSQANDLVSRCEGKIENFDKIAQEENLPVIPANNVAEGARQISRFDGVREVVRWIYEAKEGEVSPIITVENNTFFVVALKKVKEEGTTPLEDVSNSIRFRLMTDKRADKLTAEVGEKIKGMTDLNAIAEKLGQTVSHQDKVTFGSVTSGSTEPALLGAVAGAELNKICGPVKGSIGVYVLRVNNRETGAFYTEDDAKVRAAQIQGFQVNILPQVLVSETEIVDHRARFF